MEKKACFAASKRIRLPSFYEMRARGKASQTRERIAAWLRFAKILISAPTWSHMEGSAISLANPNRSTLRKILARKWQHLRAFSLPFPQLPAKWLHFGTALAGAAFFRGAGRAVKSVAKSQVCHTTAWWRTSTEPQILPCCCPVVPLLLPCCINSFEIMLQVIIKLLPLFYLTLFALGLESVGNCFQFRTTSETSSSLENSLQYFCIIYWCTC